MPMSKEDLAEAKANARKQARQNVVERGLFQFRLDPEPYERLLDLAHDRHVPVSAMVREWVEERLAMELSASNQGADPEVILLNMEMNIKNLRSQWAKSTKQRKK
jgi:hypothetical protein